MLTFLCFALETSSDTHIFLRYVVFFQEGWKKLITVRTSIDLQPTKFKFGDTKWLEHRIFFIWFWFSHLNYPFCIKLQHFFILSVSMVCYSKMITSKVYNSSIWSSNTIWELGRKTEELLKRRAEGILKAFKPFNMHF